MVYTSRLARTQQATAALQRAAKHEREEKGEEASKRKQEKRETEHGDKERREGERAHAASHKYSETGAGHLWPSRGLWSLRRALPLLAAGELKTASDGHGHDAQQKRQGGTYS